VTVLVTETQERARTRKRNLKESQPELVEGGNTTESDIAHHPFSLSTSTLQGLRSATFILQKGLLERLLIGGGLASSLPCGVVKAPDIYCNLAMPAILCHILLHEICADDIPVYTQQDQTSVRTWHGQRRRRREPNCLDQELGSTFTFEMALTSTGW
jgi:hypothetical protein